VSFLLWLENDLFLTVHVSTASGSPESVYHLITRKGQELACQKLTDPVDPFGSEKVPHHTAAKLKEFPPNLQDLLIFSSTATPDIGLVTRSKEPLSEDGVVNAFCMTELLDDSKRATLPMGTGEDMMETPSPVGTALDLSAKEPVYKPIPSDEMEKSAGPLPGYWVLNEEGVLSAWWIIYTESIRGGTTYPGMAAVEGSTAPPAAAQPTTQPAPATQSSAFGAPGGSSFGTLSALGGGSAFGTPSALGGGSAFGSASALGGSASPWASQATGGAAFGSSAFGSAPASSAPKFGQPSSFGGSSAFGQSSAMGQTASPWASASKPSFGQSGFAAAATGSSGAFGSTASVGNASGGFASFADKGGFALLGSNNNSTSNSIFASKTSADESMETDTSTSFPAPASKPAAASNPFASTTPFKLTSSFVPDPHAKDSNVTSDDDPKDGSLFGMGFATALGGGSTKSVGFGFGGLGGTQSTTPTSTPAPSKFLSQAPATQTGGVFGFPAKSSNDLFKTSPFGSTETKTEAATPKPSSDTPDVPLPPESTSKVSYPLGESSSSSAYSVADSPDTRKPSDAPLPPDEKLPPAPDSPPVDDAPLPPDPSTNKKVYDVKFPALPGADKPKPAVIDDSPLPPDPTTNKKVYNAKFPPLPGADKPAAKPAEKSSSVFGTPQPTSSYGSIFGSQKTEQKSSSLFSSPQPATSSGSVFDIGQKDIPKPVTNFLFPTNLPPVTDSDDEDEEEDEEDEDEEEEEEEERTEDGSEDGESEGSGVDVAKELSPASVTKEKTTPSITPGSSFGFSTVSKPEPERRSLFGELGRSVPAFPQPNPLSPRSPSPVRNPVPPRAPGDHSRSFTAPGMASQLLGASRRPQSRGGPITGKEVPTEDPRIEQQRRARAMKDAEETQLLVDEEDEIRQALLSAPIEPTLQLDEFIAHAGPRPLADDNIPAQVEAVYRDINSMIDTLGLNARALTNFIQGHAVTFRHQQRDQNDLANPDNWTIGELENLRAIISEDLAHELAEARVVDVENKIAECQELLRELTRDRNKRNDLQKMIDARLDPDQALVNRSLPLSAEQAARQNDLRRDFARFTKLLMEAEESLVMFRAKIASAGAASGKAGSAPTIEAVMRTITKMTSMVEKRSGDIDVLENQMRRMRFSSPGLDASTRSREGTPTPKKFGSSTMFSPERTLRESSLGLGSNTPSRGSVMVRSGHAKSTSFGSSSIGNGMFAVPSPLRRKMTGFQEEEKREIKERRGRRMLILGKLRNSVEKKGPSVWAMEEMG
jgi:nucleoporin NUP159